MLFERIGELHTQLWVQDAEWAPSKARYRYIERNSGARLLVTDFLSDDDIGVEVIMGTSDKHLPLAALQQCVMSTSRMLCEGTLPLSPFQDGPQSIVVDGDHFPDWMRSPTGSVALLIDRSLSPARLPASLGIAGVDPGWLLECVALTRDEAEHIETCGEPARDEIARRLREHSMLEFCTLQVRDSMVPVPPPSEPCRTLEQASSLVEAWPPPPSGWW